MKTIEKNAFTAVILVFMAVLATGCAKPIEGSGKVVNEKREALDFNKIILTGASTIIISQTGQESLDVEAEDNILPYVKSKVRGKTLELSMDGGSRRAAVKPTKEIIYHVSLKDLNSISISGNGTIKCTRLKAKKLEVNISGYGGVELGLEVDELVSRITGGGEFKYSGKAFTQQIVIGGQGTYAAIDLESVKTDIDISGSAEVQVQVSEELNVNISGSGKVLYFGNPKITKAINGKGIVEQVK